MFKLMNEVITTAKSLLNADIKLEHGDIEGANSAMDAAVKGFVDYMSNESLEWSHAALAMLCEEINAKVFRRDITKFFERMVMLIGVGLPGRTSMSLRGIYDIGMGLANNDKAKAKAMFAQLAIVSGGVIDECGVYEGGF